jgi:hypothetical protein
MEHFNSLNFNSLDDTKYHHLNIKKINKQYLNCRLKQIDKHLRIAQMNRDYPLIEDLSHKYFLMKQIIDLYT